jgi:hypothetical protein
VEGSVGVGNADLFQQQAHARGIARR